MSDHLHAVLVVAHGETLASLRGHQPDPSGDRLTVAGEAAAKLAADELRSQVTGPLVVRPAGDQVSFQTAYLIADRAQGTLQERDPRWNDQDVDGEAPAGATGGRETLEQFRARVEAAARHVDAPDTSLLVVVVAPHVLASLPVTAGPLTYLPNGWLAPSQ